MIWKLALLACLACTNPAQSFAQDRGADFQMGHAHEVTVPTTHGVVFDAMIDGKGPFPLIFDTGAGVNTLNPAVISQLGLTADGGPIAVPAIGGPVNAKAFRVDEFRIGDLALHHQKVFSIQMPWPDGTGPVGAVGYEIMRQLVVTIDYVRQRLTFSDPVPFAYRGRGNKISLEQDPTEVVVKAGAGRGVQGDFVVDTGDFGGISISEWFVKKAAILDHVRHQYHGVFGGGAGGDSPPGWIARIKTVCIETDCVHSVVGYLSDGQASWDQHAGTIGEDVLKRFIVTVDWPHHALYLERNTGRAKPDVFTRTGILDDFDDSGKGLKVVAVLPNSPGDKAGVKVGDRIVEIDHHAPVAPWGEEEPAFIRPAGTVVSITIQRGPVIQELKIRLRNLL